MEYIGGGTLRNLIRAVRQKSRFIQIDQVIQIGVHIAEALDYAHSFNVIHRDVKPGNIILKQLPQPEKPSGAPFRAMLSDFGLVKVSESTLKTQTGFTMGTPIYMSPEQCHGADLDGRSDIYSLGVVLYELVTGAPPFAFRSLTEALSTHMKAQMPPTPSTKRSEIPPVLDTILMRMLAKDPSDRYQQGHEVAEVLRNASGALENTPTRAIPKISRPVSESLIDREISSPPEGYSLLLESGSNAPSKIELNKPVITIGRSGNNDITLPLDGVSRFNTRLQATSAGWELTDLGGINGTFLNGERMPSQDGILLKTGDRFEIESYAFTIEGPPVEAIIEEEPTDSQTPEPIVSAILRDSESQPPFDPDENLSGHDSQPSEPVAQPTNSGLRAEHEREKLKLMLPRDKYRVKAGQSTTIALEVLNRSQELARVNARVMGLPSEWIRTPDEFVEIPARSSKSVPIKISVPRTSETPVGLNRMRVRLFSPQFPNLDAASSLMLDVIGYSEFKAGMEPETIVLPESVRVSIKNNGNLPGRYQIKLGPYDNKLQISEQMRPILLPPGKSTQITVPLEPARIRITGSRIEDRFNLHVVDIDDENQNRVMGGTVTYRPLLPTATAWVLGFAVLAGLIFSCMFFAFRSSNPFGSAISFFTGEPTPTQFTFLPPTSEIDQDSIRATSEAEAATRAAEGVQPVGTSTPGLDAADNDNDGLSNGQEAVVGTNINDPDSDKDGLTDGAEVLTHATNPLIQDTDKDTILDGEEVSRYGTDPLNPDTDGDGLTDANEIVQGGNPLVAATAVPATPTPGPTVPPTAVPTETLTPVAPVDPEATETPIPTETPTPLPTETSTLVPTLVPTDVPTEIPTEIPTEVPTLVPTEIPTDIPTEVPTLVPTEVPTEIPVVPAETITPTVEAAVTPVATVDSTPTDYSLACSPNFIPDGVIGSEWNSSFLGSQVSEPVGANGLDMYMHRDAGNLYLAFKLSAPAVPPESTIVILLDNGTAGDPDSGDMRINVSRANTLVIESGIGSNADGIGWAQVTGGLDDVIFAPNAPEAADWTAEIKIPTNLANALLGNRFRMAVNGNLVAGMVKFPAGANLELPDSLATVSNPTCP